MHIIMKGGIVGAIQHHFVFMRRKKHTQGEVYTKQSKRIMRQ